MIVNALMNANFYQEYEMGNKINESQNTDNSTSIYDTAVSDETNTAEKNQILDNYKNIIDKAIETELFLSECKPSSDSILIWDRTYKKDDYICTEHKGWGNKKTVIKVKDDSLFELAGDVLFGLQPEKIIEEYDKNNKLCKTTQFDKEGNCIVTVFNSDGSKKEVVEIKNKEKNTSEYKTSGDENPKKTTTAEYFKPDGRPDYMSEFVYNLIFNTNNGENNS